MSELSTIREFLNKLHVGKPKINYFNTNRCFYINGENVEIDSILHLDDYLMIDIEAFEEIDYLIYALNSISNV
mgnify:CR=1 FL=1